MEALPSRRVRTRNITARSANKIHDDTVAKRYGFSGGLVAGTLVYAHMSTVAVQALGEDWLHRGEGEVRLLRPAYDGEWLTLEGERLEGEGLKDKRIAVRTLNEAGEELATLEASLPEKTPPREGSFLDALEHPADPEAPPVPIAWDAVTPGSALKALPWSPTEAEHRDWCEAAGEESPLFGQGAGPRIQPGLVLQGANRVFSNHYALGPWIHASSRIVHRAAPTLGEAMELRAVPVEKWERKGHEFLTLHVVLLSGTKVLADIQHTAIFRVRPAA